MLSEGHQSALALHSVTPPSLGLLAHCRARRETAAAAIVKERGDVRPRVEVFLALTETHDEVFTVRSRSVCQQIGRAHV